MVQASTRTNPFPGLRPFDLDEEHLFFGREGQADELLTRLSRTHFLGVVGTSGSGKSSLVRAGLLPSLYSGFLADASSGWRVAILRPGNAPMRNLAEALNDPEVFGEHPASDEAVIRTALTESTLRRGTLGLVEVTQQARMEPYENLLVVVDQFEEIFRFKQQANSVKAEDEAAAFVKLLLAAAKQREAPIFVVLTMRSDFLGDCAQFRDLPEALNESQYLIPRLTRDQLRRAIEGPVAVGGAAITPQLVNRLLNDVGDNPDQLPILQHALMRTWDYWEDQATPQTPIDGQHYESTGGMAAALSRHADQIYDELPDDRSRYIAETLFKRLTDRGADNREVRRPTQLGEICAVADAELEEVVAVIDAFRALRRSFLMPPAGKTLSESSVIDISHESLMRNWPRLQEWVAQEDRSATIYRRLSETATLHQQGRANYLRDPELTIGLTWLRERTPNSVWAERYAPNFDEAVAFLEASADAREEEAVTKERAKKREINRLRTFLVLLGGLSLLTGSAAVYAFNQQQEATIQAAIAIQKETEAIDEKENANEQRKIAEQERIKAEEQEGIALEEKGRAETARKEAETQKQQAEESERAETKQRLLTENALKRAEKGENEAKLQANRAQDNANAATSAASSATIAAAAADEQANNAEAQAKIFAIENFLSTGLNFRALITSVKLGRELQQNNLIDPVIRLQAISAIRESIYFEGLQELNTIKGHKNYVSSVSISPDKRKIASASYDGTVRIWDKDGKELKRLPDNLNDGNEKLRARSVGFSPDGKFLAFVIGDNLVRIWDFEKQEELIFNEHPHSDIVRGVSFSSGKDNTILASASEDGRVKLWTLDGKLLETFEDHAGEKVTSVIFSPDGTKIASADESGVAILRDLDKKVVTAKYTEYIETRNTEDIEEEEKKHNYCQLDFDRLRTIFNLSFSSDGEILALASDDGTVKLWNTSLNKTKILKGHERGVYSVKFSPKEESFVSASNDKTIKFWTLKNLKWNTRGERPECIEQPSESYKGHNSGIWSVDFSTDGEFMVSASDDRTIKTWNRASLSQRLQRLKEYPDAENNPNKVQNFVFSPVDRDLVISSRTAGNGLAFWNLKDIEPQPQIFQDSANDIEKVFFSSNSNTIALSGANNDIRLWNRNDNRITLLTGHRESVTSLDFSPSENLIVSASEDETIRIWNKNGNPIRILEESMRKINNVNFSRDGAKIIAGNEDGLVRIWSSNGVFINSLNIAHDNNVLYVNFSPDGQSIVSAGRDGKIKFWTQTGDLLRTLDGHWGAIYDIKFFANGKTFISAGADGTLRLWSNQDGRELQVLEDYSSANLSSLSREIYKINVSSDEKRLASAGDKGIVIWNFDLDDLMVRSCTRLRDYMANPKTPNEEKNLCEGVLSSSEVTTAPTQTPLTLQLQSFWTDVKTWLKG